MPSARRSALTRVVTHLTGWRVVLLLASLVPIGLMAIWLVDELWVALGLVVAATLPVVAAVFVSAVDASRSAARLDRIVGEGRRVPADLESLDRRLDVLDLVVSSETRRPWEPTLQRASHVSGSERPVLLLPGADYHLPEIMAIAAELDSRGVPNVVAVGMPHWERTGDGLIWYDCEIVAAPAPGEISGRFSAVVTMKDWAGYAPIVEAAKDAGIPTFAKVEGAQDFHDADTNKPRNPYRTADHILCQGLNDHEALEGMERTIVGSTRLERLWWAPPVRPSKPLAVLNLNFTYGVLTKARDLWLRTATEGCEMAGIPYVISVHPAEKARTPHPKATTISASRLLRHATVLISRFSTLPYEAMARGVPFIYHNPHDEQVPAFQGPATGFDTSVDGRSLREALEDTPEPGPEVRHRAADFFAQQVDIDEGKPSESRSATEIVRALEGFGAVSG